MTVSRTTKTSALDNDGSRGEDKAGTIRRAIRGAIVERALRPGDRLPEDTLGERFGVSRTIARHALGQLASEGLVDLRRNRIAVVATPSMEEARDTFEVRIELERLVVKALAGRLDKSQIALLREHVKAEQSARGGSEAASIRLATEFHVLLAEMTGKSILTRYVNEVSYRCALTLSAFSRPHSADCAVNEHSQIIEALAAGSAEDAMKLMSSHLEEVAERALLVAPEARARDLMDILAPYAEQVALAPDRGPSGRR
ncbi:MULTISPECIES: GntR family transcriptional regulator [unclassified Devosia]|jgi:DNA-binding GntR family transcriptional regulator|uniref:GntR family transcriptional regulator n=1 Tax=unclassified Devosia TaxID=196773 RepID=UPI001551A749|nr:MULTISPECIES: GntR family transcriptional regulator [unclassified Devosia]